MERFEYISSLGEGAYGVVWLCNDRETNQKVAMKRFKDAHTDAEVMRLALREVRLLKSAQHPNVVNMLEAFRSKSGRVYIAMEYVERTLTQDLRRFHGKGFPPLLAKMLTYQLLQAIKHLHAHKVMHRDLKPANILLSADYELKLCDFGFARTLHPRETAEYTTYVVTRWYRAPEILVSDAYGPKVDVWAVGCLLGEMAGGRPLFPGKSSADQMWLTKRTLGGLPARQEQLLTLDKLYTGTVWPTPDERTSLTKRFPQFPEQLLDLLHNCLALEPTQRYTAEKALAHPYFADVPQIEEAIASTGRPASKFWAVVEDAWLSAVANANVSSSDFMKTSQSHSQINTLLNTRDLDDSDDFGDVSMQTTPNAPLSLIRRALTGHSLGGGSVMSQDMNGSATDMFATGQSICVPGGQCGNSLISDLAPSRAQSLSGVSRNVSFKSDTQDCVGHDQLQQHPVAAGRSKLKRHTSMNSTLTLSGDGTTTKGTANGPTPVNRSRLAPAQSLVPAELHTASSTQTAISDADRKLNSRASLRSLSVAEAQTVALSTPLTRARSFIPPEASRDEGAGGHNLGSKGLLDPLQPDLGAFLSKLKTKFKTFLGQPQNDKLILIRDSQVMQQSMDKVVPPLGDTHLINTHVNVM